MKRLAARASLQRPYDQQIQLFEWAVENIPSTVFKCCSSDDYKSEEILLEEDFSSHAGSLEHENSIHSLL